MPLLGRTEEKHSVWFMHKAVVILCHRLLHHLLTVGSSVAHVSVWQELNLREDELNKLLNQQKAHEQELQRREEHLRIRELDLIEREINMMIRQQTLMPTKPMPERRKGKFRKSRLKRLLKSGGMTISEPSGQLVTFCS